MTTYQKREPKYDWRKPLPNLTLAELFYIQPGILPNNNSVRLKGMPGLPGSKRKRALRKARK